MQQSPIEMAQYMAGHADPRTTKLYDSRHQKVTRGGVERIRYEKKVQTPGARNANREEALPTPDWMALYGIHWQARLG
ncbi:MAG: hypothetical protein IPK78_20875 [Rhodospirillales bacterium]|nr:hypothetical protein [Rhodospirillales bacterium]